MLLVHTHAQAVTTMKPLFSLRRQNSPHAHKFMISSVAWYPGACTQGSGTAVSGVARRVFLLGIGRE